MAKEPVSESTKANRRAHLSAYLSIWFFVAAFLSSPVTWRSPWPWIPGVFFVLAVLSLFIICPLFMIKGNPKKSKEHQLGINGLIVGIIALAILGFCIAQCAT